MKLVKQTSLFFREGRSDKVYEVDLCEVGGGQYVVNFRFGRRGTALNDGSKTPLPVARGEAELIFDKLVASKIAGGYQESAGAGVAAPPAPAPAGAVAPPPTPRADPRARAVFERL